MKKILLLAVLASLTGCIATQPVQLPDGSQGFMVDCSGAAYSWAHCLNKAARACAGAYEILGQDGRSNGVVLVGTTIIQAQNRTMIVSCRNGAGVDASVEERSPK